MDDPNKKQITPKEPEPNNPEIANDIAGPPPDPRGVSESTGSLESSFDPKSAPLNDHEDALNADDPSKDLLAQTALDKPAPEMQINPPKSRLKRLVASKKFWFYFVFFLMAVAIGLWVIQPTRTWIVNTLGLKASIVVSTRTSAESGRSSAILQKARVTLDGQSAETNDHGQARFMASYGQATIKVEKAGYETAEHVVNIDFNPFLGLVGEDSRQEKQLELQLKTIGLLLKFQLVDWLTGLPVNYGEVAVGDMVTSPDEQGFVSIVVPPTESETVAVEANVEGYVAKSMQLTIQADSLQQMAIVPAGKLYFMSNRTGELGVYSSDIDGGNVSPVVAPSSKETSAIDFSPSPSGSYAVLASTREGARDDSNNLLQKLYVVNLKDGSLGAVDDGLWFDFIDWSGDTLVYLTADTSGMRELCSLKIVEKQKTLLDSALVFGQVRVALGQAIYTVSNVQNAAAQSNLELKAVPVNGGTAKGLGSKIEILTQPEYDRVVFKTSDNTWHEYNLNTGVASNAAAPASVNRAFLANTSADGQLRLLVDTVDGVPTLTVKSVATGKETNVYGNASLTKPTHWVGNLITLRTVDQGVVTSNVIAPTMQVPRKVGSVVVSTSPQLGAQFGFY